MKAETSALKSELILKAEVGGTRCSDLLTRLDTCDRALGDVVSDINKHLCAGTCSSVSVYNLYLFLRSVHIYLFV